MTKPSTTLADALATLDRITSEVESAARLKREVEALARIKNPATTYEQHGLAEGPRYASGPRIWVPYAHGAVRITLPSNGATVTIRHGSTTDEGWYHEARYYCVRDGLVECRVYTSSRDCDGRLDRDWVVRCPLADKDNGEPIEGGGGYFPYWGYEHDCRQRDHAAEAAGY